ncbi:aminotransferase class V-fold PLP-dependent enzyme [Cytobacillus depressus]|uniref:Aminotransferase class V-fold PLP-dependent enzyme n=1 Tax=Cytobacillus depressus TaxID=1602942 RepID=A0A6L3V593_9BACI|nr:GNAT family N-acetyltransferase [Cytobacillus depressus]KAB2333327.1 aminotransferase class V-fold PLP-dependent enzyme [Cytobacillus depressus]
MYWCKVARTEMEFAEIAKLNYETFVEEIPQHEPDEHGFRVDSFHDENKYIIVLKDQELAGMIAIRDQRPFSLDKKIGPVEKLLPEYALEGKLCEIRLLAVRKEHRNGRVFFMLVGALSDYAYKQGYSAAVISGTVREQKLYKQMGFEAFSDAVGTEDAQFIPMALTRKQFEQSVAARLKQKRFSFYPGPVLLHDEIKSALTEEPVSHRSYDFSLTLEKVKKMLVHMSHTKYVHLLTGSGTLANEAMIAQLKSLPGKGLVLINGAFGERLLNQANRWGLYFDTLCNDWGQPFDEKKIAAKLAENNYEWLLMAHGETSTGMLNPLKNLQQLCKEYHVKLCVDCVSSFGALPFSLANVYLATGVSGKAIGTMSGLSFVFSNHEIRENLSLPSYLDLGLYAKGNIPFTYSSQLLKSLESALSFYKDGNRYTLLKNRYELLLTAEKNGEMTFLTEQGYPMIVTLKGEENSWNMAEDAALSGFDLHYKSAYLTDRDWIQISIIQPNFGEAWVKFRKWYLNYNEYHNRQIISCRVENRN